MTENKLPIKEEIFFYLPLGAGISIFLLKIVITIEEDTMQTMSRIPPVQYSLFIPDTPEVKKQFNTPWEPIYSFYTPKEINESTIEIVIQELINQQIIFEALHYSAIAGVGCSHTA